MDDRAPDERICAKRSDVGYQRPPVEHQFKPGQKPPARKKKPTPRTVTETLMMILREEKRIERGGKVQWITNAALLIEVAFQLAEKGNETLSRDLLDCLMASEKPSSPSDEPVILWDPDSEFSGTYHYTRKVPL